MKTYNLKINIACTSNEDDRLTVMKTLDANSLNEVENAIADAFLRHTLNAQSKEADRSYCAHCDSDVCVCKVNPYTARTLCCSKYPINCKCDL